ncbi:MAG TPA: efflux RND transporter periplasmic adaptor subunit [Bacteroidales bacterium]|nr:efflux RND transporter periplasmic adaptor subunit [Bacteroidales bacterium]
MRYYYLTAITLLSALLISCGKNSSDRDAEKQLEQYLKQHAELTAKIDALKQSGNFENQTSEVPVVLQPIELSVFKHFFQASGSVEPIREAFISPEMSGQIREINVTEGQRVSRGQVLARLNTDVVTGSIAEVKTQINLARDVFERQKRLWEQKIGSEMQYLQAKNNLSALEDRLKTLEAQLEMAIIRSPIDGVVEKINQKKGELAMPGMQMMYVVSLNPLLIKADISESHASAVMVNEPVQLRFSAYPEMVINTTIRRVGNVVNKNNRTFEVELQVDNANGMLKPNMVAIIDINDFTAENSIVVPSKVIREDLRGKYLYVAANENGQLVARKRYIATDRIYLDSSRITEGLSTGEQIIVQGFNRVSDGTILRAVSQLAS